MNGSITPSTKCAVTPSIKGTVIPSTKCAVIPSTKCVGDLFLLATTILLLLASSSCESNKEFFTPHTDRYIRSSSPTSFRLPYGTKAVYVEVRPSIPVDKWPYDDYAWCLSYRFQGTDRSTDDGVKVLQGKSSYQETYNGDGKAVQSEHLEGEYLLPKEAFVLAVPDKAHLLAIGDDCQQKNWPPFLNFQVTTQEAVARLRRHQYWGTLSRTERAFMSGTTDTQSLPAADKAQLVQLAQRRLKPLPTPQQRLVTIKSDITKVDQVTLGRNRIYQNMVGPDLNLGVRTRTQEDRITVKIHSLVVSASSAQLTLTDASGRKVYQRRFSKDELPQTVQFTAPMPGIYTFSADGYLLLDLEEDSVVAKAGASLAAEFLAAGESFEIAATDARPIRLQATASGPGTIAVTKWCGSHKCGRLRIPLRQSGSGCCRAYTADKFLPTPWNATATLRLETFVTSIRLAAQRDIFVGLSQWNAEQDVSVDLPVAIARRRNTSKIWRPLFRLGGAKAAATIVNATGTQYQPPVEWEDITPADLGRTVFVPAAAMSRNTYKRIKLAKGCKDINFLSRQKFSPLQFILSTASTKEPTRFSIMQSGRQLFATKQASSNGKYLLAPGTGDLSKAAIVCSSAPAALWLRSEATNHPYQRKFFSQLNPDGPRTVRLAKNATQLRFDALVSSARRGPVHLQLTLRAPGKPDRRFKARLLPSKTAEIYAVEAAKDMKFRRYSAAIEIEPSFEQLRLTIDSSHLVEISILAARDASGMVLAKKVNR